MEQLGNLHLGSKEADRRKKRRIKFETMWTETTIDWTTVSKNESKGNVVIVGLSPGEEKQFQLKKAPHFYNSKDEDRVIATVYSDIYPNTQVYATPFLEKG